MPTGRAGASLRWARSQNEDRNEAEKPAPEGHKVFVTVAFSRSCLLTSCVSTEKWACKGKGCFRWDLCHGGDAHSRWDKQGDHELPTLTCSQ